MFVTIKNCASWNAHFLFLFLFPLARLEGTKSFFGTTQQQNVNIYILREQKCIQGNTGNSMLFIKLNYCQWACQALILPACLCPSQQTFWWDNQNKTKQLYVSTKTAYYPKYIDQFLMNLLVTFTTGLVFVRWSKQGAAVLCWIKTAPTLHTEEACWAKRSTKNASGHEGCKWMQRPRAATHCFNHHTKKNPVLKVASKFIKNWSRYLG